MCTVKRLQSYGAFVALDDLGRDGLVHISQLDPAGGRVSSVESAVSVGDRIRLRVLSVDGEGRLGLTAAG
eukprot:3613952-Prymnesium_polylepis.1